MDEEDDDISADDWDIKDIVHALEHLNLHHLELHSGASDPMSQDLDMTEDDEYKGLECTAPKSTPLKSLKLIDCNITTPDLHNILRYPKALQYLSIYTRDPKNTCGITQTPNRHVVWDDVFDSIAQEVGSSLIGFRFSPNPNALVPAPNLHKLTTLRYLELHHHLLAPSPPSSTPGTPTVSKSSHFPNSSHPTSKSSRSYTSTSHQRAARSSVRSSRVRRRWLRA